MAFNIWKTLGVISFFIAAYMLVNNLGFVFGAKCVNGRVIRFESFEDKDYYVVGYEVNGKTFEINSSKFTRATFHVVIGSKITVFYKINDPKNARIFTFTEVLGGPITFSGFGLAFFLYSNRKKLQKPKS